MQHTNLVIALSYFVIPAVFIWVVGSHRNWQRLHAIGVAAFCLSALFVLACGRGHWLHWRSGMAQPWDFATAAISAVTAIAGVVYAEKLALLLKSLLDSEAREQTLARREQMLSRIFEGFPPKTALVLAKGDELEYQQWSSSFVEMYGVRPHVGDSHYTLFPQIKTELPAWVELHQAAIWRGESFSQDEAIAYPKPNGETGWLIFTISVIADACANNGEPPYLILMIWKDVTQNQELKRQVDELVYRDSLTGLYNKRFFDECLERMFADQERNLAPISLLLIDLDNFKNINDRYGHQGGDAVLREAADRISRNSRGGDIEVRWAGDELAIICLTDAIGALKAAHRLHAAMTTEPINYKAHTINLECSIGVATAYTGTPEQLLSEADAALYVAKEAGRNQVKAGDEAETRLALERQVEIAVEAAQIKPYYQPIVSLKTGAVIGSEALARWEHDGVVDPPAKFLQIIEASPTLCRQFCDLQLRSVCEQAGLWQRHWNGWISFNLSQESLKRDNPAEWLHSIFADAGISPTLIAVEATEQLQMAGPELRKNLALLDASFQDLMSSDLSILLDDFAGPGGGSGTQLSWMIMALAPGANSRLLIKLDRAVVSGIDQNPSLQKLTMGLIVTFHSLGFQVIAEGIETAKEAQCLTEMGCDFGQGWYWGKAVPAYDFEQTWLQGFYV